MAYKGYLITLNILGVFLHLRKIEKVSNSLLGCYVAESRLESATWRCVSHFSMLGSLGDLPKSLIGLRAKYYKLLDLLGLRQYAPTYCAFFLSFQTAWGSIRLPEGRGGKIHPAQRGAMEKINCTMFSAPQNL